MACATPSIRTCASTIAVRNRRGAAALALGYVLLAGPAPGAAAELQQPPTSYPLCTAASLAGFPWTHPAFGKSIPGIALRNMSLQTCRVAGYPELRAYGEGGGPAAIRFERRPFIDTQLYAYAVTPGAAVFFTLYGRRPRGDFDRSCVGITQVDVMLPNDRHAIGVTVSTGTCGGSMQYSQMFPVGELEH